MKIVKVQDLKSKFKLDFLNTGLLDIQYAEYVG